MPESVPDFITVIDRLTSEGVRFVLIGGLAMIAHGSSRLANALRDLGPRPRDFPQSLPFVWGVTTLKFATNSTLTTAAGDVDLIGEPPGVSDFEALYARSIEMELFGHPVRVASLDDLEAMKRAVGRSKDLDHLRDIQSLRRINQDH